MSESRPSIVGADYVVEVGPVAHGGHCVARHEGLVLFVRHALPGERVRARVTSGREGDRFLLAEAVEVLQASPHRVSAPCRYAGPAGCGGCDFQHADVAYQRELKAYVVREQLSRLAGLDREVTVLPLPLPTRGPVAATAPDRDPVVNPAASPAANPAATASDDGLRWRTRTDLAVDRRGRVGFHPHRSRAVLPIADCLIASEEIAATGVFERAFPRAKAVHVVASSTGERAVVVAPQGLRKTPTIHEQVRIGGTEVLFRLNALGFWQVHPAAAQTLTAAVLAGLEPRPGERCVDLYAGVGLFARALADAVGGSGEVLAVESDARAAQAAADHFADEGQVSVVHGRVDHALTQLTAEGVEFDHVVLDPPRTGAGREVMAGIARLRPTSVAYVACDPAALARDLAYGAEHGYELTELTAYDAFPMTHHVECVAILRRAGATSA